MTIENSGPAASNPDRAEHAQDTGEGHHAGLERTSSQPRQDTHEGKAGERPVDWTPPAGNPGSDQDAQTRRENGGA